MKIIESEYENESRLKITGSGNTCFGNSDVEICNFKFKQFFIAIKSFYGR